VEVMRGFCGVGNGVAGRAPLVSLLFDFPWFRLPTFETGICARISRSSEADFIPGPGMRVVGLDRILEKK
jgi:hypothetical protein